MEMNALWLILIIPLNVLVGAGLVTWYFLVQLRQSLAIKTWNLFQLLAKLQAQQELINKIQSKEFQEKLKDLEFQQKVEQFKQKYSI